jgi:hypothetical protein
VRKSTVNNSFKEQTLSSLAMRYNKQILREIRAFNMQHQKTSAMSDGGEEQGDVSIEDTPPARDECERHQGIDHQLNLLNSRLQGNVSKEV